MEYKVYGLKDPRDKEVKYVGVSKNVEVRYKQHYYTKPNEWILELKEAGLRPEVIILETINTEDRNVALNKEKEYIAIYGTKK